MNSADNSSNDIHRIIRQQLSSGGSSLLSSRTRQLYDWWSGFGAQGPRRKDFDILDHPKLVPHLYLYHLGAPGHVDIRINGEIVADAFGSSWAGTMLSVNDANPVRSTLAQYLLTVAEAGYPYRCVGTLQHVDRGFVEFESIDCPLRDDSGSVSHIVGCLDPDLTGHGKFAVEVRNQDGD